MAILKIGAAILLAIAIVSPRVVFGQTTDVGACIDEDVRADLDAKRRKRFVKTRLYQKTNRHELSLRGGYFVSDVFDGSALVSAAYSYHLTETFAVEAAGAFTRVSTGAASELERLYDVLPSDTDTVLFSTNLVFSPVYAKFQVGGDVVRFDLQFTAGAGVVDSKISSGVAANAGIGFVFWGGRALAVRFDFRNYVHQQELLAQKAWVNDLVATLGFSTFLPFSE